eukprot:5316935-Amphidinium_carterae.1
MHVLFIVRTHTCNAEGSHKALRAKLCAPEGSGAMVPAGQAQQASSVFQQGLASSRVVFMSRGIIVMLAGAEAWCS